MLPDLISRCLEKNIACQLHTLSKHVVKIFLDCHVCGWSNPNPPLLVDSKCEAARACDGPTLVFWPSFHHHYLMSIFQRAPELFVNWVTYSALLYKSIFKQLLRPGFSFSKPDCMWTFAWVGELCFASCKRPTLANSACHIQVERPPWPCWHCCCARWGLERILILALAIWILDGSRVDPALLLVHQAKTCAKLVEACLPVVMQVLPNSIVGSCFFNFVSVRIRGKVLYCKLGVLRQTILQVSKHATLTCVFLLGKPSQNFLRQLGVVTWVGVFDLRAQIQNTPHSLSYLPHCFSWRVHPWESSLHPEPLPHHLDQPLLHFLIAGNCLHMTCRPLHQLLKRSRAFWLCHVDRPEQHSTLSGELWSLGLWTYGTIFAKKGSIVLHTSIEEAAGCSFCATVPENCSVRGSHGTFEPRAGSVQSIWKNKLEFSNSCSSTRNLQNLKGKRISWKTVSRRFEAFRGTLGPREESKKNQRKLK